jgi:hypothetical protein
VLGYLPQSWQRNSLVSFVFLKYSYTKIQVSQYLLPLVTLFT